MNADLADVFRSALSAHQAGQIEAAEATYRRIVAEDPTHSDALRLLGLIAQQRGQYDQAIELYRRAEPGALQNASYWNNLGAACTASGRFGEAVSAFERALRLRGDYPDALSNLGATFKKLGRYDEAVLCLQQAIELRPDYAAAHCNLGVVLQVQGDLPRAQAAFEQALRLKPDYPEAANGLGMIRHENGDVDGAMEAYRHALAVRPQFADASNNLATALKETGHLDESLQHYRMTLRLEPDHALAHYNVSEFAREGRYRHEPEELDQVCRLADDASRRSLDRSLYAFAAAGVLDTQGRYDESFGYYRRANELRRETLPTPQQFDRAQHRALVDRIIAGFDAARFEQVRGWGVATSVPIFLIGMPRSGSTLIEQILATDPIVFSAGEIGQIPQLLATLARQAGHDDLYMTGPPCRDAAMARNLATTYLEQLRQLAGPAPRVTVKTLQNFLHLGVIATILPGARIIHCRRDPIDVCLSCYFQNFHRLDFAWSLEDIGFYYREYERLMAHWRRVLPLEIHDVSYEELIARPEEVTRPLFAACGLQWSPRSLRFFENRGAVRTASSLQVRKPLSANSIGRWQRYRRHLEPLFDALGMPRPADVAVPQEASPSYSPTRIASSN
jgi:tetratricopeptide (TPR) repeat protein